MNWAHFLINLIASILVSGKAALHANSERHLIASWKIEDWISLKAWADKKYLERVHHGCELGFKHLCDNFTRCLTKNKLRLLSRDDFKNLKSELNNVLILVRCCYVKDREDISPSRLDVMPLQKQQGCQLDLKIIEFFWRIKYRYVFTCICTILATHLTTMSLTVPHLLFFMMCSKGLGDIEIITSIDKNKITWENPSGSGNLKALPFG